WPSKDLIKFFNKAAEETAIHKSGNKAGQTYTKHNWDKRLFTQPGDSELLTRDEIQGFAPDLLVTNYSMLEYMLLRPIERSIFKKTSDWLHSDKRNQLLLILDEAHMYRGVSGAEVGLLTRRLQSRLGITRNRLRCILTSASLGTGEAAEKAGRLFAEGLTGRRKKGFAIIRGTREDRSVARPGTEPEAQICSQVDPAVFAGISIEAALDSLALISTALGWPSPPPLESGETVLRQYVARQLTGFGPLELLLENCAGN